MVTNRLNLHRPVFLLALQIIIVLLACFEAAAQSLYNSEYLPPDPQTWGFVKYGGLTPDLYTGAVKAEIPVYTYKDPDFEIPITLSYTSSGYMPNITANYVGLGWTMNVGGIITRKVRGVKDEGELQMVSYNAGYSPVQGYYRYTQTNHGNDGAPLDRDACLTGMGMCYLKNNSLYETESDIYLFNFMGHTGKFVIKDNGDVQVYDSSHPSGEYKVSLSDFQKIRLKSKIVITTGDGYKYEFGGHPGVDALYNNHVEFEKWGIPENNVATGPARDEYSDEWRLTKITAPNGRTVVFNYKIDNDTKVECIYPTGERVSYCGGTESPGSPSGSSSGGATYSISYRLLQRKYAVLPSSITIDDCTIAFTYSSRTAEKGWKVVSGPSALLTPPKLDSIKVTHTQAPRELCNCSLTYKYPAASGNQVLLLSKVNIKGSGQYSLNYYNEASAFPYQGVVAMDHWGYYNNNSGYDPQNLLPSVEIGYDYRETVIGTERNPNWTKVKYGLLQKIKYPTGGWTIFEYEPNDYSKKVERRSSQYPGVAFPYDMTGVSIAQGGGVRVSRVADYVSSNEWTDRRYTYLTGTTSSGTMLKFPRYSFTYSSSSPTQQIDYSRMSYSGNPGYLLDEPIVEYTCVKESYRDNSSKEYRFSTIRDILDEFCFAGGMIYYPGGSSVAPIVMFPQNANLLFRTPSSMSTARGKLLSMKISDIDGNLRICLRNNYNVEGVKDRYTEALHLALDSIYLYRHYTGDCLLSDTRETEYTTGGDSVAVVKNYYYNFRHQQKYTRTVNSDGLSHYTLTARIGDGIGTMTIPENKMKILNIVDKPIYEAEYTTVSSRYVPHKVTHYVYDYYTIGSSPNVPLLSSVEVADVSLLNPLNTLSEISTLSYKRQSEIVRYNAKYRPCEMKDGNGISAVLLWGYGGLYPVALIQNVTGSQLGAVVHSSNISDTIFGWNGIDLTTEHLFRGIPGVSMTTWKYSPFVGITEKTGPDGRKTTYTYNLYGRLSSVTGPDSYKVSQYMYSINGQMQ